MERRLGKGLGSLLGDSSMANKPEATSEVAVDKIAPNPHQPRKDFDEDGLKELEASIRRHGVLQPLVVMRQGGGYLLVAGERRLRAAKEAGLQSVPVVLREDLSEADLLELALVENVQRRDLNPIERAVGFREMLDRLSITQEAVAQKVGLRRSTVANHLRLLELPKDAQDAVRKGVISMGHARALLGLQQTEQIKKTLEQIVRDELSVRDVERLVRNRNLAEDSEPAKEPERAPSWLTDLETRLRNQLGTKVSIKHSTAGAGQIVVQYYEPEDLERVCELIAPKPRLD